MPRQYGQTVENALGGSVGLRQLEANRCRVNLLDADGLAPDDQEIALRRMNLFILIHLKGEHYIAGVERVAVGKAQPAAELQSVPAPVRRNLPGFCEGRFGALRQAIDMNQVGMQAANDVAGDLVHGQDWIKGFGFGEERDNKP